MSHNLEEVWDANTEIAFETYPVRFRLHCTKCDKYSLPVFMVKKTKNKEFKAALDLAEYNIGQLSCGENTNG